MNSVTPLTATSGGSQNALSKDVEGLVNTLATNGGGIDVVFIAAPAQAAAMRLWAGPHFSFPILASAALANGTVVAVEASSFVSGFGPEPQFDTSEESVIHAEDSAPLQLATGAQGSAIWRHRRGRFGKRTASRFG